MSESGAALPLTVSVKVPWVRSWASRMTVVETTWDRLEGRLLEKGTDQYIVDAARAAYVAGAYACSAAVLNERAHSQELSEAAWRIERG
jgi:hypothetical protein